MISTRSARFACFFALALLMPIAATRVDAADTAASDTAAANGGTQARWAALVGSAKGVHGIDADGKAAPLWTDGSVRKLLRAGERVLALGSRGIVATKDFRVWETLNAGLPVKTIKRYRDGRKSFDQVIQELKDLEADPADGRLLVTATKDAVFLSRDGGATWKNLGFPWRTNGLKAVAVASLPGTTVFAAHGIYGVQYLEADKPGAKWTELNAGLERLESTENPDEVSDITVAAPAAGALPAIFAAQTFKGRVYRLDWATKAFVQVWTDGKDFGTAESLNHVAPYLRFVREGEIAELRLEGEAKSGFSSAPVGSVTNRSDLRALLGRAGAAIGAAPACIRIDGGRDSADVELSELWLLSGSDGANADNRQAAAGREGLYLPANHAADPRRLAPYLSIIEDRGLDMVVVDMKDDYGRLRFRPRNAAVAAKGRVFDPIDVEAFVSTMKQKGVWLVARVVVFKDPELAKKEGGKFAVWDAKENAPWVGYTETRQKKAAPAAGTGSAGPTAAPAAADEYEIVRTLRDERWVDPYAEEVWDYVATLSEELIERGFDEIQFDYIRFPTDGDNLADARYRWREQGMDMESAIYSFLSHARERIRAPISVDIYGANGWYRTGARTGQEVELISHFVDVICPMYYPSHFEQNFLAYAPAELRPYRIYYRGTLRTRLIARGDVVVRPYAQSFYLNVAYDRKYYGADYVRRQLEGVRDAGGHGLTYWNNVGRYDEIPLPVDTRTAAKGNGAQRATLD